jgi:hypothetical protein
MYAEKLAAKYGLEIDTEHFDGLVFVYRAGSENSLGYCKIFTQAEIDSHPDIESEFAEMAIKAIWTDD